MQVDILLLTVYFICLGYVIYQMALSLEAELEDQIKVLQDQGDPEKFCPGPISPSGTTSSPGRGNGPCPCSP
ncbi:MAG: hypothetical protein LVS60_02410 [Nodosilinea sp. LVE1205-7]|jgi:hypothetical protein